MVAAVADALPLLLLLFSGIGSVPENLRAPPGSPHQHARATGSAEVDPAGSPNFLDARDDRIDLLLLAPPAPAPKHRVAVTTPTSAFVAVARKTIEEEGWHFAK